MSVVRLRICSRPGIGEVAADEPVATTNRRAVTTVVPPDLYRRFRHESCRAMNHFDAHGRHPGSGLVGLYRSDRFAPIGTRLRIIDPRLLCANAKPAGRAHGQSRASGCDQGL